MCEGWKVGDITAILLTIGERYVEKARLSIAAQTVKPEETLTIKNVSPFSRAMNLAVDSISTEFFVQVDADMVLDKDCLDVLSGNMDDRFCSIKAPLRDPLLGCVSGVHLWRAECCRQIPFPDSVSPETDIIKSLMARGWQSRDIGPDIPGIERRVGIGSHAPGYHDPLYTFLKFRRYGAKTNYRGSGSQFLEMFQKIRNHHPAAPAAYMGLSCGVFETSSTDTLSFPRNDSLSRRALRILHNGYKLDKLRSFRPKTSVSIGDMFLEYYSIGRSCQRAAEWGKYASITNSLVRNRNAINVAGVIGINAGLLSFCDKDRERKALKIERFLSTTMPEGNLRHAVPGA